MKKSLLVMALVGVVAMPVAQAQAAEIPVQQQKDGVIVGSMLTGAAAAGPFGAAIGMIAGVWLGDRVEQADQAKQLDQKLTASNQQLDDLRRQLAAAEKTSASYAQAMFDQLQLELSFRTGDAELPPSGRVRLDHLAEFMVNNPSLKIRLDGYADPRGGDTYNQTLSSQRVQWVKQQLVQRGVQAERIAEFAHGDRLSTAKQGDLDAYALERVVKMELSDERKKPRVAQQ